MKSIDDKSTISFLFILLIPLIFYPHPTSKFSLFSLIPFLPFLASFSPSNSLQSSIKAQTVSEVATVCSPEPLMLGAAWNHCITPPSSYKPFHQNWFRKNYFTIFLFEKSTVFPNTRLPSFVFGLRAQS